MSKRVFSELDREERRDMLRYWLQKRFGDSFEPTDFQWLVVQALAEDDRYADITRYFRNEPLSAPVLVPGGQTLGDD